MVPSGRDGRARRNVQLGYRLSIRSGNRVCSLRLLLGLASAVSLGSEYRGSNGHTSLSQR
jgi:hypothetical protein